MADATAVWVPNGGCEYGLFSDGPTVILGACRLRYGEIYDISVVKKTDGETKIYQARFNAATGRMTHHGNWHEVRLPETTAGLPEDLANFYSMLPEILKQRIR